jgi:predicted MPP superfamily phosphohydrolase
MNNISTVNEQPTVSPSAAEQARNGLPMTPIITFVTLWLGVSWLVVGVWLHGILPGGWWFIFGVFALLSIAVWSLTRSFAGLVYPSAARRLFVFRPFWYAMLFSPLVAASILLGALLGLPFGESGNFGRWALALSGPLLGFIAVKGYMDSRRLVVRRLEVHLPRLPTAFDRLRVVQISDLHVGPHTPRAFLDRVRETVQDQEPDLIVITGDQVDDFARDVEHFNAAFGGLRAPLGIFVIAGNHDVYAGWEAVRRGLLRAGFNVLVNESVALERGNQRLWLAGTGDPAASGPLERDSAVAPDINRTLQAVANKEPVLVLAHNPALWPELARRGVDLTLSGHTHSGQFAISQLGWSLASAFLQHAAGAHRQGQSLLYINPGTNYWGLPLRFGTPPEVTVLTLKANHGGPSGISESRP